MKKDISSHIPPEVIFITQTLKNAGFEAYLIGGCVRDLLRGKNPHDWDITTDGLPEEVQALFPHTYYENDFGTVGIVSDETEDKSVKNIEVTTYRLEATYSNNRHPDIVTFSKNIEDDLKRRDFTINAIAYDVQKDTYVDPYKGQDDIKDKILQTVGNAQDRFKEDALRMMRAIRLSCETDFEISRETQEAIQNMAQNLATISTERIRDEFIRIVDSEKPMYGILLAQKLGVLPFISPELEKAKGVEQDRSHQYDVYEHLLRSLQHASDKGYPLHVKLAALFHDISKPESRRQGNGHYTFYGHEVTGAKVTRRIMERLKFPKEISEKVVTLVRWHMFFSDPEQISLSAVRRMINNVGKELIWDLMYVRICDRIGTGRPKEQPYRFRKYQAMIEEVMNDPVSVGMLKIDGKRIMTVTRENPGPKIGLILHTLLDDVLEDPSKNTEEYLENKAKELATVSIETLKELGERGKKAKETAQDEKVKNIRQKHHVE